MRQRPEEHETSRGARRPRADEGRGRALLLLLVCCGLAAPVPAADQPPCEPLRDRRRALEAQALKAEVALVRTIRQQICPALSHQADGANAIDRGTVEIDYQALLDCRHRAEERLLRSRRPLYVNRRLFRFYTASGADLARQADELGRQLEDPRCAGSP